MSKQLFEFVKVAAGEPVDVGSLVCYMQPDLRAMVRELAFGPGGKAPHDFWILRPAESPDAGREREKPTIEFDEVENGVTASIAVGNQISISEGNDNQEAYNELIYSLDIGLAHEHGLRSVISITAESALSTPADPGSQVEAVDFTEWWINEGWQIRKDGTFLQIGSSATPMLGRPDDRFKSVHELFTLYKQSL